MEQVDCVVIGAGVVGLAIAREAALTGREVIVLEAAEAIGTHTSSRNSEVIHAGLYYPKGSAKARFCVEGKELLYRFCQAWGGEITTSPPMNSLQCMWFRNAAESRRMR